MVIREITAEEARPLRRRVLRDNDPTADVHFPEDDDPASFHLGADNDGELVAIASFTPSPTPYRSGASAWQLRGMAVAEDQQRGGLGALLLHEAQRRIAAGGASVLWCNARDSALAFYARLGFVVHGDGFVTTTTGLPHHVMVLDL